MASHYYASLPLIGVSETLPPDLEPSFGWSFHQNLTAPQFFNVYFVFYLFLSLSLLHVGEHGIGGGWRLDELNSHLTRRLYNTNP